MKGEFCNIRINILNRPSQKNNEKCFMMAIAMKVPCGCVKA